MTCALTKPRLEQELRAALGISKASPFHSAEMLEGVKATAEYLCIAFGLDDPELLREVGTGRHRETAHIPRSAPAYKAGGFGRDRYCMSCAERGLA